MKMKTIGKNNGEQLDLNLMPVKYITRKYKLLNNQLSAMRILYLNDIAFSSQDLFRLSEMEGYHSIYRFIKRATKEGWVREIRIVKGATVNNLLAFYKFPDKLENGQKVKDSRCKHYQITELGRKIFKLNEKPKNK